MSENFARTQQNMANTVAQYVAQGWRVESQTDTLAILAKGQPTNHTFHLILSLVTFGLWLFVWPLVVLLNRRRTMTIRADAYGNITVG